MAWEGIPPVLPNSFLAGGIAETGGYRKNKEQGDDNEALYKTQHIFSFIEPKHHKKLPYHLVKAKNLSKKLFKNPLSTHHNGILSLSYHLDKFNKKNKDKRKIRSEFRAFVFLELIPCIIHYLCSKELKLGIRLNDGFKAWTTRDLLNFLNKSREFQNAKKLISYRQLLRGLRFLESRKYLNLIEKKFLKEDKGYRSHYSSIEINIKLFDDLGITNEDWGRQEKKEESDFERYIRDQKRNNFKLNYRKNIKEMNKIKKETRRLNLKEITEKFNSGKTLTKEEKDILEKELPGCFRRFERRTSESRYTDYTGCSNYLKRIIKPPPD